MHKREGRSWKTVISFMNPFLELTQPKNLKKITKLRLSPTTATIRRLASEITTMPMTYKSFVVNISRWIERRRLADVSLAAHRTANSSRLPPALPSVRSEICKVNDRTISFWRWYLERWMHPPCHDVNIIEHLWDDLKEIPCGRNVVAPSKIQELEEAIQE